MEPSTKGETSGHPPISRYLPWLIWSLGALFYGYGYFQRVATSVMVEDLMRDFAVGAAVFGNLSAFYYYAYAGMQIPVGILNDRFGPRRILTAAAFLAALGTVLFAFSPSIEVAYAGRLLIGLSVAFAWVSTLKLASIWFPPHRFATVAGLTLAVGMMGGILGQAPLSLLIDGIGWRSSLTVTSIVAFALSIAIWLVVRDARAPEASATEVHLLDVLRGVPKVLTNPQIWFVALFAISTSAVALGFIALWGVPFLMEVYAMDRASAASAVSMGLVGQAVGAPLSGWVSDTIRRRKSPMMVGLVLLIVSFGVLVYGPLLPTAAVYTSMFLMGVGAATSIITFAAARENMPAAVAGVTVACMNTFLMAGGAIMQPISGWLLDLHWDGTLVDGVRVYGPAVWRMAFAPLIAFCIAGVVGTALIRETYCKPVDQAAAH